MGVAMREIVAQEQPRPRWLWIGPICASAALAGTICDPANGSAWTVLFVLQFAALLVVMVVDLLLPADRKQAIVTDNALLVGRWWHVVTIARKAVRGGSRGRSRSAHMVGQGRRRACGQRDAAAALPGPACRCDPTAAGVGRGW